jgi:hypothetical protein
VRINGVMTGIGVLLLLLLLLLIIVVVVVRYYFLFNVPVIGLKMSCSSRNM